MQTFQQFLMEVNPAPAPAGPPPGGGLGTPGALPGGGMGPPPAMGGGLGMPALPGGGMGPPPAMGGMGGATPGQGSTKLKAYNVWDVLERVLQHAD